MKVVFLLVPNLHLLDLAGPAQVFSTAADFGHLYELAYVAEREEVPSAQGLRLRAETSWPALAAARAVGFADARMLRRLRARKDERAV